MKTNRYLLLPLLLFISTTAFASETEKEDPWKTFRFFVGSWEGTAAGQSGSGTSVKTYEFILGGMYIRVQNTSIYPPQEKNPKGEKHEDLGIISFDKSAKTFVLRQFHIEGFVNEYRAETVAPDGKRIVFITEAIENIPPGWKARETYTIQSDNEFLEVFELAEPGKEFSEYSRQSYKRIQK